MEKILPIVMITSDEFAPHCATCMASILKNISNNCKVHFFIYTNNMKTKTKTKLQALKTIKKFQIDFLNVNKTDLATFDKIYIPDHVSKLTYARILAPKDITNFDKLVYIDADMIVRTNIEKLYDIDLKDKYFGACLDANYKNLSKRIFDKETDYFNCGLLLINAKKLREENFLDQIQYQIDINYKKYKICDQSVLNDVFKDKFLNLPITWNFYHDEPPFCKVYQPSDIQEYENIANNPAIVHFCGIYKPWYSSVNNRFKKEYLSYRKMTHFYNIIEFQKYRIFDDKYRVLSLFSKPIITRIKFPNKIIEYKLFNLKCPDFYSVRQKDFVKIVTILGIKFKFKNKLLELRNFIEQKSANIIAELHNKNKEINTLKREVLNLKTVIYAQNLHNKTFSEYKNAFCDKDVVLVCTGPSAKQYQQISNAIHVGVNGAIYLDNVNLDYIFAQDYTIKQPNNSTLTYDILNYNKTRCKKFFGIIPDERLKEVNHIVERIPLNYTNDDNIAQYILEDVNQNTIAYDLSREPIGDFSGTVFSALQFILYCNPKNLYIVGWDCSSGYAYGKENAAQPANYQLQILKNRFLPFIKTYYPNINIKTINPVGLKGLFTDVYTTNKEENVYV